MTWATSDKEVIRKSVGLLLSDGNEWTVQTLAHKLNVPDYSVRLTLNQMLKDGLVVSRQLKRKSNHLCRPAKLWRWL